MKQTMMCAGLSKPKDDIVLTANSNRSAYTRRSFLGFSTTAAALGFSAAACVTTEDQRSSFVFEEGSGDLGPIDLRYAPQFYVGNPEADFRIEVAWSLQCEYTQRLYSGGFKELIENVLRRKDALIVFHHLSRTEDEIATSELLLSLEPRLYGPTLLVVLEYFTNRRFVPRDHQIRSLVERLEVPFDPNFDEKTARYSTALLNIYLKEKESVDETPSLFWNGKWKVGATSSALTKILREAQYDVG